MNIDCEGNKVNFILYFFYYFLRLCLSISLSVHTHEHTCTCTRTCTHVYTQIFIHHTHTFSLSVPNSLVSTLFLRDPGAWAVGRDEWNTKSRPFLPDAFSASIPALTTGSKITCGLRLLANMLGSCDIKLKEGGWAKG